MIKCNEFYFYQIIRSNINNICRTLSAETRNHCGISCMSTRDGTLLHPMFCALRSFAEKLAKYAVRPRSGCEAPKLHISLQQQDSGQESGTFAEASQQDPRQNEEMRGGGGNRPRDQINWSGMRQICLCSMCSDWRMHSCASLTMLHSLTGVRKSCTTYSLCYARLSL